MKLRSLLALLLLALLVGIAPARAETAPYDVVVVGGGPAGLAAGLEARLSGAARVLVLEKRDEERGRVQSLNLRAGVLHNLARLGVSLVDGENAGFLKELHVIDDRTAERSVRTLRAPEVDPARATHLVADLLRRGTGPVAVMGINDLEYGLMDASHPDGIETRYEDEVLGLAHKAGLVEITTQSGKIDARLVFVADGANSALREQLGIGQIRYPGKITRIVGGTYAQPGLGQAVSRKLVQSGSTITVAKLGGRESGILAEVPPGLSFVDAAAREAWFHHAAGKVGVSGALTLAPSEFEVALSNAERVQHGENVFLIGDAARTTHVLTGLGVNFALRDAHRAGVLVRKLRDARSPEEASAAKRWFARETMLASMHLHRRAWHVFDNVSPPANGVRTPAPSVKQLAKLGQRH